MDAQLKGDQNVMVLCCDAGRALSPSSHLWTMKLQDVEKCYKLLKKNGYDICEESCYILQRRVSEDLFEAGRWDDYIRSWYPQKKLGSWSFPDNVRMSSLLNKYKFDPRNIPGVWNKCAVPSAFFRLMDGVLQEEHDTYTHNRLPEGFHALRGEQSFCSGSRVGAR